MPPTKAIFLDAGGTLLYPYPSVGEVYSRVALLYGMRVAAADIDRLFVKEFALRDDGTAFARFTNDRVERVWWKELVTAVFTPLTELRDFESFFDDLYERFARAEAWRLYPETESVVDELRGRGLKVGIVSNWDSRLERLCESMGIRERFDFILASAHAGYAKPDRRIFDRALEIADVGPGEVLHVGDSLVHDWEGARNAGIRGALVKRSGEMVSGVTCIRSLRGIGNLLALDR